MKKKSHRFVASLVFFSLLCGSAQAQNQPFAFIPLEGVTYSKPTSDDALERLRTVVENENKKYPQEASDGRIERIELMEVANGKKLKYVVMTTFTIYDQTTIRNMREYGDQWQGRYLLSKTLKTDFFGNFVSLENLTKALAIIHLDGELAWTYQTKDGEFRCDYHLTAKELKKSKLIKKYLK